MIAKNIQKFWLKWNFLKWKGSLILSFSETYSTFSKIYSFIWKAGWQRGRGRKIFHLLVHSLNAHNTQGWARPTPESGAPSSSPIWVTGTLAPRPSSASFPGRLAGSRIRSRADRIPRGHSIMACGCGKWWLNPLCQKPGPSIVLFSVF